MRYYIMNPDVADPEEASQAELVGTVGTMESVEREIDLLVTTVSALTNSVNKLVGGIEAKEEKVTEQSKKSSVDLNGKKRRNSIYNNLHLHVLYRKSRRVRWLLKILIIIHVHYYQHHSLHSHLYYFTACID